MRLVIINNFSPSMLGKRERVLLWEPITLSDFREILFDYDKVQSYVANSTMVTLINKALESDVFTENKSHVHIGDTDTVIQVTYNGPHIEEPDEGIPDGGKLNFWVIRPLEYVSSFMDSTSGVNYLTYR